MEANKRPKLIARIDPDIRDRVRREADQRFQGNESMVARAALETYFDLRDALGFDFERVISDLIAVDESVAVAS